MKQYLLFGCLGALMIFFASCGGDKDEEIAAEEERPFFHSNMIRKLFDEKSDAIENNQSRLEEIEVLSLADVVTRMKESGNNNPLKEGIVQRAQAVANRLDSSNYVEFAFACRLTGNAKWKQRLLTFMEKQPEIEIDQFYSVYELFEDDEEVKAALLKKSDALLTLSNAAKAELETLKQAPTFAGCFRIAELSKRIVLCSIMLGKAEHEGDYEYGVASLMSVLEKVGRFGELNEGLAYSMQCIRSLALATRAMMLRDDDRAFVHDCWLHFSDWLIHFLQPGRNSVNYGDARGVGRQPREGSQLAEVLAEIAFLRQDPIALWALKNQFSGYPRTVGGFGASTFDGQETKFQPAPFGYFPQAGMLTWRDHWGDDSSGVWVRGGHSDDVFDHYDRGHLSYTLNGKPVFWDSGMPNIIDEEVDAEYRSCRSHNVLSIDGDEPLKEVAPIIVRLLDENRGNIRIDSSRCYPTLSRWHRDVFWRVDEEIRIVDELSFKIGQRGRIAFRWHLADAKAVDLVRNKRRFIVETKDVAIVIQGNEPIIVSQSVANDYSMSNDQEHSHTVLLVESIGRPTNLKIMTRIVPKDAELDDE